MKRIVRLTESDITRIVRRVIMEGEECPCGDVNQTRSVYCCEDIKKTQEIEQVEVRLYKFVLSKPEDGVNYVVYHPSSGEFSENGKSKEVWAKIQPNLSKEEVTAWFKRNNIKIK
jgi:hypothetical protein